MTAISGDARGRGRAAGSAERRVCGRIPLRVLGGIAVLQAAASRGGAVSGRLVNISGGGCCLVISAGSAGDLMIGSHCMVSLPVASRGLHHPATVVHIEPYRDEPQHVRVRVRFRKADHVTHQRLIQWIGELAIQAFHVPAI